MTYSEITRRARARLLRMHFESGVGHIGGNLSALDALLVLHHEFLRPHDLFVLSKGHAAGALYVVQWTLGIRSDDELATFHRDDTALPAHPPARAPQTPFASGSLGHGCSLAAGSALGLRLRREPGQVYVLTSDGEWEEGSTWEALIFAAHHRLANLTILIDRNGLQGFGTTASVASLDSLAEKIAGFDVEVRVVDGHDPRAIRTALIAPSERPRVIVLETVKGHGIAFMEDRLEWHYRPLTRELYELALEALEKTP